MTAAIIADDVSKRFRWHRERRDSVKERIFRGKGDEGQVSEFWALQNVSFEVEKGTTFGLVGHNGCGKSTMLKLLAGIFRPTSGTVATTGRISALLELGAGFHPELTGRENIYLNGSILGLSRKQVEAAADQIVDFAGIGDFIDVPVKVYSSGMYVRLGFSIAVTVQPEILIVDEIVAVGDEEFQRKCFDHLHDLKKKGTTIVLVTHSLGLVETLCDQAIWLDHGESKAMGAGRDVVRKYLSAVNEEEAGDTGHTRTVDGKLRMGSGEVKVVDLEFLDGGGNVKPMLLSGEPATFRLHYESTTTLDEAAFGLSFVTDGGVRLSSPSSLSEGIEVPVRPGKGHVDFTVPNLTFQPGGYDVSTAVVEPGHIYDYHEDAYELKVRGAGTGEAGLVRLVGSWTPDPEMSRGLVSPRRRRAGG